MNRIKKSDLTTVKDQTDVIEDAQMVVDQGSEVGGAVPVVIETQIHPEVCFPSQIPIETNSNRFSNLEYQDQIWMVELILWIIT